MAIVTEQFEKDGRTLVRTWSDKGVYIHGGFPEADYEMSIDPLECGRIFTETDIPIEDDGTAEEIVNILTGESE